jgi:hypothetical protein
MQLLMALECFSAADEAYLSLSRRKGREAKGSAEGHRHVYFVLKGAYLAEAFKAFLRLDQCGWFGRHSPTSARSRSRLEAALCRLRSAAREETTRACPCCKRVHDDWPPSYRIPPATLQRLRNKAGFHWDREALRKAYRDVIEEGEEPAVFRFIGTSVRGVHSPLATSLFGSIISAGEGGAEAAIPEVLSLGDDLRTLAALAVGEHLHSVGARLEPEPRTRPRKTKRERGA